MRCVFVLAFLLVSLPATAEEAVRAAPAAGSSVVTSVSKCFDALGPEASAEIKRNSLTPYADCQKRLREKEKAEKGQEKTGAESAETPRSFRRVTDGAVPAEKEGKSLQTER